MREENLCETTKKLGFGCMRFPKKDGEIDIGQVKEMVDLFLDAGFTYFDTAFVYQGSEEALKTALVDRYPRDRYTIATKNAAWSRCNSKEEAEAQFETSLERTGAGYFDYYLLHNLGKHRTEFFEKYDLWNFVKKKKEEGKIRHIGFSFHSTAEELDEILTAHPEAEFVQLQINYADWNSTDVQSKRTYETARKHGKPVVIMEPVKGGLLANPPMGVEEIFRKADSESSCASWAIRFAAGLDGVITVLSGMSSVEQMKDNISFMKDFQKLNAEEMKVIEAAQQEIAKAPLIPCTTCNYCAKVCPMNIGISGTFMAMNFLNLYHNMERAKSTIGFHVRMAGKNPAKDCIQCGACESVCPQHIEIRRHLQEAAEAIEE